MSNELISPETQVNPFQQMAMVAINSGKVEQLGQLLELQQKWEADQARKAFVAAMVLFKAEPIHIGKNKLVSFKTSTGKTEYNHAELVDVTNALVPAMARHGLSHDWSLSQDSGAITVICTITHRDGHSKSVSMTAPPDQSGGKNTIQAIASTKTYLERYTLLAATGVATGGEIDDDARGGYDYRDEQAPEGFSAKEEAEIRRKREHDDAEARHSESVAFIKERIAAEDWQAVADEWRAIPEIDQMALWLATTKGGCFSTYERSAIKEKLPSKQPVNPE